MYTVKGETMEKIRVTANMTNTTLLKLAKLYTVHAFERKDFDNMTDEVVENIVLSQFNLFRNLLTIRKEVRRAVDTKNTTTIEQIKAGRLTAVVSFDNYRLDPVEIVAVII